MAAVAIIVAVLFVVVISIAVIAAWTLLQVLDLIVNDRLSGK